MAKKYKKGRKGGSRRTKRGAPKKDHAIPMGAAVGTAYGVSDAIVDAQVVTILTKWTDLSVPDRVLRAFQGTVKQFATPDTYMPVLIGLGISASPKIPLIRMLAKPADKALRRMSKGKVSL